MHEIIFRKVLGKPIRRRWICLKFKVKWFFIYKIILCKVLRKADSHARSICKAKVSKICVYLQDKLRILACNQCLQRKGEWYYWYRHINGTLATNAQTVALLVLFVVRSGPKRKKQGRIYTRFYFVVLYYFYREFYCCREVSCSVDSTTTLKKLVDIERALVIY